MPGYDLTGARIVITGAAGGLGYAAARLAASQGAHVACWCHHDSAATIRQLRTDVPGPATDAAFGVDVDTGSPESIAAAAQLTAQRWDSLNGLVNCAATFIGFKPLTMVSADEFDHAMAVNARGTWLVTKALLDLLTRSGTGRIVNIGTDTVSDGTPNCVSHVASKSALVGMTRGMASELGPRNITVNLVVPGLFDTPHARSYAPPQIWDILRERQAITDRNNTAADIAGAVVFLLTPSAARITGQTLAVNAGSVYT